MIALIWFVLAILASPFKSKSRLEAENAVLRHQLMVLRRKVRGRAQLANNDRWFFVQMYQWFPSILEVATVTAPECPRTLVVQVDRGANVLRGERYEESCRIQGTFAGRADPSLSSNHCGVQRQ